jgi:cytidylate kinase
MAVVTISRQFGCGGLEVAAKVCELLGYSFFDKGLMAEVATDVDLSASDLVDFSEDNYNVKSFWERLFGRGPKTAYEHETGREDIPAEEMLTTEKLDESQCILFIRSTIRAAYQKGGVVILGRGAQAVLRDMPDVLHVRLTAAEGARVRRVESREKLTFSQAYQLMVERDQATDQYLDEFFGVKGDDPMLYHLILNTGKLSTNAAAQIIAAAVGHMEAEEEG